MKLSMKSRYGLRALIDLSVNSKNEQVALGGIAERNNISPQYLEQVFASLRKAGIVKSIKGSQGGYFLNKPAEQITISEVIEALEGDYRIEAEDVPEDCDYKAAPEAIQKLVIDKAPYLNTCPFAFIIQRPPLSQDLRCILQLHLLLLLPVMQDRSGNLHVPFFLQSYGSLSIHTFLLLP